MANDESIEWAKGRLRKYLADATPIYVPSPPNSIGFHSYKATGDRHDVASQQVVVEKILDKYTPGWRNEVSDAKDKRYEFRQTWEAARRCLALLEERAEIDQHLSDRGPTLDAASLHPWVWDAAKPAWEAGQYEDAVDAAARNINSRLRAKVDRKDIGEGDLIGNVFSQKSGDDDNPRLRLPLPQSTGDPTLRAIYGGISQFGQGLYSAVRNPLAHEAPGHTEIGEAEALESLAAFSLLARWIDRAAVKRS